MATKNTSIQGLRVAILVTDGVEEAELIEPRKALNAAGAKTTLISPKSGQIQAMNHDDKTNKYDVDVTFKNAKPEEFDAVLLPGGALNADALRVVSEAQDFVREIDGAGKPIAFICHAPWLLVSSSLVKGRTLTSYHTIRDDVHNAGGKWVDEEVVRDRNWVSSRQPADIPAFNREMISLFGENKQADKSKRAA
ncbi:MAG: type 1 glutamine amidotransferase domain-containing protein [Terriglobales bacterium]